MDLKEMGSNDGNWMDLAQDRNQWRANAGSGTEPPVSLKAN